ncbi:MULTISPECIES: DUF5032 domain-containing protein [unclassified Parabacteroides]|uniref:DUF5032 domain-containing protein n=1 Tax=unclassified Parabacteroides TaxID=2649774 RepID=UPI00247496CA|nr:MULTISPECIES: DUF5032 domain-containing protein [unclassified Parabacteroides]
MKKNLFIFLSIMFGLTSCGDDDKTEVIPLNKLTKITCTKNNASSPEFVLSVTYNQAGEVANIAWDNQFTDIFSFSNNQLVVNRFTSVTASASLYQKYEYGLSGGGIVSCSEYQNNPYRNNEEYLSNLYNYTYSKNNMMSSPWVKAVWPKTDGSGYESRNDMETNYYTWEDNNLTYYKNGTKEMAFTYKSDLHPENFPLRIVNTFSPTGQASVSPLNFYFGNLNRNLIETATWYVLPDVNTPYAKYTFSYNTTGEYITGMTIAEEIYPVNGTSAENNQYTYTLEYSYK